MHSRLIRRTVAVVAGLATALGGAAVASAATAAPGDSGHGHHEGVWHVLLISVDGLHQQDLAWYVQNDPKSVLASLVRGGLEYSNASTPFPSDSTPGMVAQVTGGDPGVTGEYYDDTWNHDVFPAGTTNCSGPVPGGEVAYEEFIDKNSNALDAGQGLAGLPGSILQMTSNPLDVINPANRSTRTSTSRSTRSSTWPGITGCGRLGRTNTPRTRCSTGPRGTASRTSSLPRSTARRPPAVRTGPPTTP